MPTLTPSERILRAVMIDGARHAEEPGTLTYTDLGRRAAKHTRWSFTYPMIEKPFRGLGKALGKISTYEHSLGRPLITALVVQQQSGRPGEGFAQLARSLGRLTTDDEESFWLVEVESVREFWQDPDPTRILDAAVDRLTGQLRSIQRAP